MVLRYRLHFFLEQDSGLVKGGFLAEICIFRHPQYLYKRAIGAVTQPRKWKQKKSGLPDGREWTRRFPCTGTMYILIKKVHFC
jgi:hypothetical protein